MRSVVRKVEKILGSYFQVLAAAMVLILALDLMLAVRDTTRASATNTGALSQIDTSPSATGVAQGVASASAAAKASSRAAALANVTSPLAKYKPGSVIPGVGTIPLGIDFKTKTIRLGYYWKGYDQTSSAGASNVQLDEGTAFWRFVQWINKHANDSPKRNCNQGGATCFMGYPFNLHGFKIDESCITTNNGKSWGDCVVQAGEDPAGWNTAAFKVRDTTKPFAAISSHGGLSDYACPILADAHIFNPVTYNVYPGLVQKHPYCFPQGLAWEKQVQLTISWLKRQNKTQFCQTPTSCTKRVYGIEFAEYPGLHGSVDQLVQQLVAAGINVGRSKSNPGSYSVYSVSTSLVEASRAQAGYVAKFREDGVNTMLFPDSGAPITFTQVAPKNAFLPDYYVWPCSGEDAAGQVRLFDSTAWSRASGLSCYDYNWDLDLTLDDNAHQSQWFNQYQEMACPSGSTTCDDPPSTAPLVYEGLLPVLAGLTVAGGPDMTMEKFFAGIHSFDPYPYHAIAGKRSSPSSNFLVTVGAPDGSQIGDVAEVIWDSSKQRPGNTTTGAYDYSSTRYRPGYAFM